MAGLLNALWMPMIPIQLEILLGVNGTREWKSCSKVGSVLCFFVMLEEELPSWRPNIRWHAHSGPSHPQQPGSLTRDSRDWNWHLLYSKKMIYHWAITTPMPLYPPDSTAVIQAAPETNLETSSRIKHSTLVGIGYCAQLTSILQHLHWLQIYFLSWFEVLCV